MRLDPAVAATRLAVRRMLAAPSQQPVLVACSGGADSLALVAAAVFETRSKGRRASQPVLGVTIDHGLQEDSAERADAVVAQMADLGVDATAAVSVTVDPAGQGVEAAAREARYAALRATAAEHGSNRVLLGHTRDDQAETVLMGLTRGSGGRSIAGMRQVVDGLFFRPFLNLTRAQTEAACRAQGIAFWTDPHNADRRFTRARIRHTVMPVLERELGPGVASALARTGDMLRADLDALDEEAEAILGEYRLDDPLPIDHLAGVPPAVRLRVLRLAALRMGSPPSELTRRHVLAVDGLVRQGNGVKRIQLPGHVHVVGNGEVLTFGRAAVQG